METVVPETKTAQQLSLWVQQPQWTVQEVPVTQAAQQLSLCVQLVRALEGLGERFRGAKQELPVRGSAGGSRR